MSGVEGGEMYEHLNDLDAEQLLSGDDTSDPLAATLESLRHHYRSIEEPVPDGALLEFVSVDLVSPNNPSPKKKDRKMSISTIVGTAVGKVLIGASVAAASVGGAHVTGVVDVPVLPDVGDEAIVEVAETDESDALIGDSDSTDDSSSDDSSSDDSRSDDSTSPTSTTVPTSTTSTLPATATLIVIEPRTFTVLDGGTVTIEGDSVNGLVVLDATPADGWTAEIETDELGEAGVNFRRGDERVDFRAEIEDGHLRIRFRDRRTDTRDEIWFDEDGTETTKPASSDSNDDDSDNNSDSDSNDDDSDDNSDSDSDSDDDDDDNDSDSDSDDNSDSDSNDDDNDSDNSGPSDS